jgi:hypothetical protein
MEKGHLPPSDVDGEGDGMVAIKVRWRRLEGVDLVICHGSPPHP